MLRTVGLYNFRCRYLLKGKAELTAPLPAPGNAKCVQTEQAALKQGVPLRAEGCVLVISAQEVVIAYNVYIIQR